MSYTYCEVDLLSNPQKYMYPKYGGVQFLKDFTTFRKSVLQKQVSLSGLSVDQVRETYKSFFDTSNQESDEAFWITDQLLSAIQCDAFYHSDWLEKSGSVLGELVKKFEISKKIHASYDKVTWKVINKQSDNINNYMMFSNLLSQAFLKNHKLDYFNAILKLNDITCSVENVFFNSKTSIIHVVSLLGELDCLELILKTKKIFL